MNPDSIQFDRIEWQSSLPGARFKTARRGSKQMRILELTSEFVEPHWCEKGHTGIVLQGELEVDFHGRVVRFPEGSGLFIPPGPSSAHKARSVTPVVRLFLVEDI